jgi:hypothetical protein
MLTAMQAFLCEARRDFRGHFFMSLVHSFNKHLLQNVMDGRTTKSWSTHAMRPATESQHR